MANTIDTAFVKQFESEVHLAFQRMGAKLLNTVRRKTNITGESTTFQKIGTGTAATKSRNAQVPLANLVHTNVEASLSDYYLGEYVDKLDELKIQHDERGAVATSLSAALGRQSDQLIIDALDGSANDTADTGGVTKAKLETVYEAFGNNDVADDGQRYFLVSPQGWTDLMGIAEFASRDYVPEAELPWKGAGFSAKRFMSFFVMTHSGLSKTGSVRSSLAYHRSAVGAASGAEVGIDVTWQGKEQANLIVASMSQGAALIDDNGVYKVDHTES